MILYHYKKLKRFLFFILIFILCCVTSNCKGDKDDIYYDLGYHLEIAIRDGISAKSHSKLNYKKDKYYIIISDFSLDKVENQLILAYCEGCDAQELVLKTNRFCFVGDTKIPILFESDFFFTKEKEGLQNRKNSYRICIGFDKNKGNIVEYF